jgi:hypothetical protein
LRRHQQGTEQRHGNHHRRQPVFLVPQEAQNSAMKLAIKFLRTVAAWWMIRFAAPAIQ